MRMKRKAAAILILCLTIFSLLFAVLWQRAENSKDDIRQLAQASASDAYSQYAFCNEVYGYLVLSPETSQKHMAEIIEVMEILSMNVENEDGYLRMADLRNNIQE